MKLTKEELYNIIREVSLNETQLRLEQQCMDYLDNVDESMVSEILIKKVMRKGKAVRKKFCKMATQKQVGGRCVPKKAKERIKKSRSMRKAARKKKGKQSRISRKMKKSLKRGSRMGLYKRR